LFFEEVSMLVKVYGEGDRYILIEEKDVERYIADGWTLEPKPVVIADEPEKRTRRGKRAE